MTEPTAHLLDGAPYTLADATNLRERQEWKDIDRTGWPHGEWDHEPDETHWVDAATGLSCLARRNGRLGFWCGYVAVGPTHPYYGQDRSLGLDTHVHGGITHSGRYPREEAWWFGFDCAHYSDFWPTSLHPFGTYRTLPYVLSECTRLAAMLAAVEAT